MKNKSKIKITDLSSKIRKSEMKPLSDSETNQIIGGMCPWCPNPRASRGYAHG